MAGESGLRATVSCLWMTLNLVHIGNSWEIFEILMPGLLSWGDLGWDLSAIGFRAPQVMTVHSQGRALQCARNALVACAWTLYSQHAPGPYAGSPMG